MNCFFKKKCKNHRIFLSKKLQCMQDSDDVLDMKFIFSIIKKETLHKILLDESWGEFCRYVPRFMEEHLNTIGLFSGSNMKLAKPFGISAVGIVAYDRKCTIEEAIGYIEAQL